mmetsp:Transcript_4904/g.6310  ORF Transcript_4904/g.6310 Transcript_4904/m.6310 type:complete len:92 (-) Transcript_4904:214-489(-)
MSAEQETQLIQLRGQKESLEKDRDMLKEHMEMLQNVASECTEKVRKAESATVPPCCAAAQCPCAAVLCSVGLLGTASMLSGRSASSWLSLH